jgi:ABC-type transport system involved in multi-copper enzyme maturation permease subunit
MTAPAVLANIRWEVIRLIRSKRVFLLSIPPVAGPIGSAIAFLYFHVQYQSTALLLGLLVTGGLSTLVMLDLAALSVGEELSRRAHYTLFTLPQERWAMLAGRVVVVFGASLAVFALGAALVSLLATELVPATGGSIVISSAHLIEGVAAMLVFLGAVTLTASIITRSSSEALVAGILSAVVTIAVAGYFLLQGTLTMLFPAVLVVAAVIAFGWSFVSYSALES